MDYFKSSFSPYELFSSLISGIPILQCLFLRFTSAENIQTYDLGQVGELVSINALMAANFRLLPFIRQFGGPLKIILAIYQCFELTQIFNERSDYA
jgi:hypothetical protein